MFRAVSDDLPFSVRRLNTAQQFVDAGFGAGLRVYAFDDNGAVEAVAASLEGMLPDTTTEPAGTRPW